MLANDIIFHNTRSKDKKSEYNNAERHTHYIYSGRRFALKVKIRFFFGGGAKLNFESADPEKGGFSNAFSPATTS